MFDDLCLNHSKSPFFKPPLTIFRHPCTALGCPARRLDSVADGPTLMALLGQNGSS